MVFIPFGLPLLYIFPLFGSSNTFLLQAILINISALLIICSNGLKESLNELGSYKYLVIIFSIIVALSTLLFSSSLPTGLLGLKGDYQGAIFQLSSLLLGLYVAPRLLAKNNLRDITTIMSLVCAISIIVDLPFLINGIRLSGLLLHDTAMSLYAAITFGFNIIQLKSSVNNKNFKLRGVGALVSLLAVLLTASRIGLFVLIAIIVFNFFIVRKPIVSFKLSLIIVASICVLLLSFSPASRLVKISKIHKGVSYRLQLYEWSIRQSRLSLIGLGASQTYRALIPDGYTSIPPVIKDTLNKGYPLWYTHSQFIDKYIQYGALGSGIFVSLVAASVLSYRKMLLSRRMHDHEHLELQTLQVFGIALIATLGHFMVDTPNIILAPIVYISLFGIIIINTRLSY
ncbi:MAG: O-antigen ligase family protein [Candidatus Saccharibacteria bacterium]